MSQPTERFLAEHAEVSRRFFLRSGVLGAAALSALPLWANNATRDTALQAAIDKLEDFMTTQDGFRDVSRGKPKPHSLPPEKLKEVGLTRETWSLDVLSDPENPARLRKPLSKEKGTALDFAGLMKLADQHAVRLAKVMTCLNIGCPLGTGIWEGVPLRDVLWLTTPRENLRRVFYYGYHNDDPAQMFRSSLPVDRIFEDPPGLPPVILCYKLNGEWLTPERGGPVRMVVPEGYGFKSVKWLSHVFLSNLFHANDTYANGNNDVSSSLKSFAATLSVPNEIKPNQPIPITGYAQVGVSGVSKVQAWIQSKEESPIAGDPYYSQAPWRDAEILPPPVAGKWGSGLPAGTILPETMSFDATSGAPQQWPMHLLKVHWAVLLPGLPEGKYTLRCRTVDDKGYGQPMPRPFKKSGHATIEQVDLVVKA